jgi:kynurenine 3-monooxygenase
VQRETITVIGAGPVGALLAALLARRGFDVEVYERRPDPRLSKAEAGRSINIAVSTRGLFALHQVGQDREVLEAAVPMRGRMLHAVSGAQTFQRYGKDDSEFINSMSRGGINDLLMTAAEQAHTAPGAGRVRLHFRQRLTGWDPKANVLTLHDEATGASAQVQAGVVIGTDGSASALRQGFAQRGVRVSQDLLDAGYKELTLPAAAAGQLGNRFGNDGRFLFEPHALHIWPRGRFMLIALPNPAGDFTCTLFLPFEAPAGSGEPCFARLTTAAAAEAFFRASFPDVAALIPDLGEAFVKAPLGRMVTVRTDDWWEGSALLLGDAAHAIVPFFGQGMNAGFEDCTLFDEALGRALEEAEARRAPLDWPSLFLSFSLSRKPDTDAIAALALENFIEMRDRVADPVFQLHRAVEAELQKRLPGRYLTRYQLVTFSRRPYRVAFAAGRVQAQILEEVCRGCTRLDEVDLARATALAEERLLPLLK